MYKSYKWRRVNNKLKKEKNDNMSDGAEESDKLHRFLTLRRKIMKGIICVQHIYKKVNKFDSITFIKTPPLPVSSLDDKGEEREVTTS